MALAACSEETSENKVTQAISVEENNQVTSESTNNVEKIQEEVAENEKEEVETGNIEEPEDSEGSDEVKANLVTENAQEENKVVVENKEETNGNNLTNNTTASESNNNSSMNSSVTTENKENSGNTNGNSSSENNTGTSTGTGSGSASGGIVFVHEHTWQKMSQKIADAYTYQEIVQYGYSCGCCETVFDTYSEICPSCGAMCMNNNYVFEDRYVKDKYSEYEVCISCGSTRNVVTVEK